MLGTLKRAVTGTAGNFRECRDCGTTVDRPATDCPNCDSAELAIYDLSDLH